VKVYGGFSQTLHRLTAMLARMAGEERGIRDALMYYATALSGAYYVVPSADALHAFASVAG
jgi:putative iron-dependent peroxidase